MSFKRLLFLNLFIAFSTSLFSQTAANQMLAKIRNEGLQNSKVKQMLTQLIDVYGQRLTGSDEYLAAAQWIAKKMKDVGLDNVRFEKYCDDCRGWSVNTSNLEMIAPNYMQISGFPLAYVKGSNGTVSGELVHISSFRDMESVKADFTGKLKGKVVLLGNAPSKRSLFDPISRRFSEKDLKEKAEKLTARSNQRHLPDLLESWKESDFSDDEFLKFVEAEGALAVLKTRSRHLGAMTSSGTYYYKNDHPKPLPYFSIMPEHFGRLLRMLNLDATPTIRLNLDTRFYSNPDNNVNIVGQISGDRLDDEQIIIGAHFDSWHTATGATDNGANSVVLVEALRILKKVGYQPNRNLVVGLWGGEEQAFVGSVSYATRHFGELAKAGNSVSKNVSVYLNLDNGAGAIRGINLQENELARPLFEKIFNKLTNLSDGTVTIENSLSTDHETFDHYNIPSFQFIQDPLAYSTATHHTNLDLYEYVHEEDMMKNAVILAWTIYSIDQMRNKVVRTGK